MKNILTFISLIMLASCSSNTSNYYLKEFETKTNLQEEATSEVLFNNIIYTKIMDEDEVEKYFGSDLDDYTVVFFNAENISDNTSFFKFDSAKIHNGNEDSAEIIKVSKMLPVNNVDLEDTDEYANPFIETEMEENNFAYNLNKKILNNFVLEPKQSKKGFLIFNEIDNPKELEFFITSGTSIYTARSYKIALDK